MGLAPEGTGAGIELLNANEQLRASDGGRLVVIDEADGREFSVALTQALELMRLATAARVIDDRGALVLSDFVGALQNPALALTGLPQTWPMCGRDSAPKHKNGTMLPKSKEETTR